MRLIDADALIEQIESEIKAIEDKEPQMAMGAIGVLNMIKRAPTSKDEESITIQTGQTYGKSAYVTGNPDTDLISRQGVIDAIEETDWYHINKKGEMVSGSTSEHESWYKHDDIMLILETIPSPPVELKSATDDCISRQEAIDAFDGVKVNEDHCNEYDIGYNDGIDFAVSRLSVLPSAQPEKRTDKHTETHGVCSDCISRQAMIEVIEKYDFDFPEYMERFVTELRDAMKKDLLNEVKSLPPVEDMGEVSDGYHTFNQLYHQRAVLFASIVNQHKDKAWKSWKHEDGEFCFDKGGEWFIVGVDTPEGSYTYHYKRKYWDLFNCEELDRGKHWDGHTEDDVTRLLSLPPVEPVAKNTTTTELETDDENELKFYYVESLDDYWVGRRLDNFYYATWHGRLGFIWSHSKYLPWGEHIVDANTLWKEHTYPSEPIEIPFTEWIVGFVKKYFAEPKTGEWVKTEHSTNENGFKKWIEIRCPFCGHEPVYENIDDMEFCPKCGCDCRGDTE